MLNKMADLNNHLFAQLERLGDEDVTGEELAEEIGRAKAVADISARIIDGAALVLKAAELADRSESGNFKLPPMLEG